MKEKEQNDLGDTAPNAGGPGFPLQSSAEDGERISAAIPIAVRIEPQPKWEENPGQDGDGNWCGRYHCMVMSRSGEPDVDVDVDVVFPPSQDVRPVELEKVWYWVPRDSDRSENPRP